MIFINRRRRMLAAAAGLAVAIGAGGVMLGRTVLAPSGDAPDTAKMADETAEGASSPEGFVPVEAARSAALGIRTERAILGSIAAEILAQANVTASPQGEAALTARVDGAVVRINKRLGEPVRAGETVAVLESREAATIAAERAAASARSTAARQAYAREQRLYGARVTARQDLEAAQATLTEADAELLRTQRAAAAARLSADGRSIAVSSLISGRITKVSTELGAYVSAGAELFRVADPSRIQVEAAVTSADARRIRPGDRATLELGNGETRRAIVRALTPSVDAESRAATVVLVPDGVDGLTPGQGLRVSITPQAAPRSDRIVLSEGAIQSVEGREVVFVRTRGGFQATPVTIGARSGGRVEILAGLRPEAEVVTAGAFLLKSELGKEEAEE